MTKAEEVKELKYDAIRPKEELMEIMDKLVRLGCVKDAKAIGAIIIKIEVWQISK